MPRKLRYYGDPVLRKKGEPVKEFNTPYLKELIEEMDTLMQANDGMGLAAPQLGESLRIFIFREPIEVEPRNWTQGPLEVFINPVLSEPTQELWLLEEGCLSLAHLRVPVERPLGITIEAYDIEGKPFKRTVEGIVARAYMHENDHLNGVLTIDRTNKKYRQSIDHLLRKMKDKYNP